MDPEIVFYSIIALLLVDFAVDTLLDYLNARHFNDPVPEELHDVYDATEYKKSQVYKKVNYRFSLVTSVFFLIVTLAFFFLDGFDYADTLARSVSDNEITVALLFFGMIMLGSDILATPFAYYGTFVIEEKFGFNKTTLKTFFLDKIKGWLLTALLGGGMLALIIWLYGLTGKNFWWYAWGLVALFIVFMNMFYSKLIVPLFNRQQPLEAGSLRAGIEAYAAQTGFRLDKIVVIDGSKRSTKANAYFSGFGAQKRVTLYDTLLNDLEEAEIVAVLAHEVGHYRRRHIIFTIAASVLLSGFTLFILSLFISLPELSLAIGVQQQSFHAGLIAFGILYSPVSAVTGLIMNYFSRKFEYQADAFARLTFNADALIAGLKKLSKKSLSNLTPHPAYVFVHYSHPTLLQRIKKLRA
ncbi:MAG: M48 family metallopeptidase [Sinomicrobium sp.]|nr:M48 family metallopeptidase [Sinomicrobium sp.]